MYFAFTDFDLEASWEISFYRLFESDALVNFRPACVWITPFLDPPATDRLAFWTKGVGLRALPVPDDTESEGGGDDEKASSSAGSRKSSSNASGEQHSSSEDSGGSIRIKQCAMQPE